MSDSESSSSSEDEKEALDEGQVQAFEDKVPFQPLRLASTAYQQVVTKSDHSKKISLFFYPILLR